ncbi:MAG: ABC transporter permease [Bacteroidia bacterium]
MMRKLGFFTAVMLGLLSIVFALFQALPSADQVLSGQRSDAATTQAIVKDLGLDEPLHRQFLSYVNDVSPLSIYHVESSKLPYLHGWAIPMGTYSLWLKWPYLRKSFVNQQPVGQLLAEALLGTAVLALSAMMVALLLGVPMGILAAFNKGTWIDHSLSACSALGISIPSFFSAMLISWLFGFVYSSTTGLSMTGSLFELDPLGESLHLRLDHLILPAIALGIRPLAVFVQLTRNTLVEVMNQDYIRLARAKGLNEAQVLWRHALPNALNPLVTSIGGWFSSLLAGSFFTEYIFQWKGLGKVTIDALQQSDLPVIMGAVLFTACVFFLMHSLTERLYVWMDPRLRPGA